MPMRILSLPITESDRSSRPPPVVGWTTLSVDGRWQPASAPATTVALAASALPKKIRRLHTGWVCAPRCSRGCIWCLPNFVLLTIRQDIRQQPAAQHVREKLIGTRGRLAQSNLSPMHQALDGNGDADVLTMPASATQGEQVGMKKARHRPSGHTLPFE